ncbi:hypothetical protein DZ789_24935, partial [Salmonella enterica subsp. enterica serovar Schwarzengrund]|nr:hypothetical protein [Salmonella enterica]EBZ1316093.1 hypothetical protein [Salmonella enterica subsp. enterica serovar Schwarzengrund]EAN6754435.1 hypothetical protein [Salmonella enterica]EAQ9238185.1 hypothetical protein [Salmonella enterica]EAU7078674.1 hypothetical protein [Salmonella enterica]
KANIIIQLRLCLLYHRLLYNASMYYATITPYRFTKWLAALKINLPMIYKIIQQGTSDKSHSKLWLLFV